VLLGRLLELAGDSKRREMIVHDRTRLIGLLIATMQNTGFLAGVFYFGLNDTITV